MSNDIKTSHGLDFLCAEYPPDKDVSLFKIGTCHGQWYCQGQTYVILSVMNDEPGNGHLEDVFEWFEFACRRDGYKLKVQHIFNERFYKHLIEKRGFVKMDEENVIKMFMLNT
jgi:hypothetical protein